MFDKMLLYDERQQEIEKDEVCEFFTNCAHIRKVRCEPEVVAAVEGDFASSVGTAIIRLISSGRMLAVEGDPAVVVEAIMAVKQGIDRPLHAIDEGYTFDIALDDIAEKEDLVKAIEVAGVEQVDDTEHTPKPEK